eukprot:3865512-Pyramimonas_sp.AAC.1
MRRRDPFPGPGPPVLPSRGPPIGPTLCARPHARTPARSLALPQAPALLLSVAAPLRTSPA